MTLLMAGAAVFAAGCAKTPRTTRVTVSDMEAMGAAMATSLAQSEALAERGPDAEPWVVSIHKVENLSDDVMTQSEQWAIIARLRGTLPIQALREQKNVRFVIPAEQTMRLRGEGGFGDAADAFGAQRRPTHLMTATFRSVTRAQAERRTDLYYMEFVILDIADGTTAWTDRFEFKREAKGHVWD